MEIESSSSKNGSKIRVQQNLDLGRGLLAATDPTVSRRHISFNLHQDQDGDGTRGVSFQVKGKNPIWVRHESTNHDHGIRVYKTSQRGELKIGDSFCVSSKDPCWFNLTRVAAPQHESNSLSAVAEIETGDISDIDPVKEFNFIVMGQEFDCYQVTDIRNWNWFLEQPPNEDTDDDDDEKRSKKRKKGGKRDDDDVWTGESEEDAELIKKLRNDPKPKYSTRSKDKRKKGAGASSRAKDDGKKKAMSEDDDDDDDDEGDETLGGFIVDDEDTGEGDEDDDEEDEFEEDEDDDDE